MTKPMTPNIEQARMKRLPNNVYELASSGGKWLAEARTQIQNTFANGDSVTWGSQDRLKGQLTVKDFEEVAAHIAYASIKELTTHTKNLEDENKRLREALREGVSLLAEAAANVQHEPKMLQPIPMTIEQVNAHCLKAYVLLHKALTNPPDLVRKM